MEYLPTVIICAALAGVIIWIVISMVKRKKKGKPGCGCNCSGCMSYCGCSGKENSNQKKTSK